MINFDDTIKNIINNIKNTFYVKILNYLKKLDIKKIIIKNKIYIDSKLACLVSKTQEPLGCSLMKKISLIFLHSVDLTIQNIKNQ